MQDSYDITYPRYKIAVIGGGVAGVSSAYYLSKQHDVTLFEANESIGGHTNTRIVEDPEVGPLPVDTGFIVCNDTTYPLFHQFLADLGVKVRNADMSFGFYDETNDFGYAPTSLKGILPKWSHLFNSDYLTLWTSLNRFNSAALYDLENQRLSGKSLGEYLQERDVPHALIDLFIVPMGAAIWSSSDDDLLATPAETFLGFFKNHGLLSLFRRPQWQTVVGGSHSYLKAFQEQFKGEIRTSSPVEGLRYSDSGCYVTLSDDEQETFDIAVVALHADLVLSVLDNPSLEEKKLFSTWRYHANKTVLHTDRNYLPPQRETWASWNYRREKGENGDEPLSVTYHMNRLQGYDLKTEYCVTLNPRREIPADKVLYTAHYTHPMYSIESVASQTAITALNGSSSVFYCGSYLGYGFHEDAVRSANRAIHYLLGPPSIEFEARRKSREQQREKLLHETDEAHVH